MVHLLTLDAATANVTNTTFAHKIGLANGPFGLQEFESVLSFPERNGRSWTVSVQTSDAASVIFAILVVTFAIDHYLFNSRYLVHINGVKRRDKDGAAVAPDEKAALHEKEAPDVESGRKGSNDEASDLEPKSDLESDSPAQKPRWRWVHKAAFNLVILFVVATSFLDMKKEAASKPSKETPESSSTKAEAEREPDTSPPSTSPWGKFRRHPWSQRTLTSVFILLLVLGMLLVFGFHLVFWPSVLTLLIALECAFIEELNPGVPVPWQPIALKSTLPLAVWTIVGVTLLMKPNRLQVVLWKCFKWTHAVTWWLFWGIMQFSSLGGFVGRRIGFPNTGIVVLSVMRPSLVAYLYSGVVCNVVFAVRLIIFFWNNDITKS